MRIYEHTCLEKIDLYSLLGLLCVALSFFPHAFRSFFPFLTMSSLPLPCPCCPKCRAEALSPLSQPQIVIPRKLPLTPIATSSIVPRRSTRILEQQWRVFYRSCLDVIDTYDHLREVDVKSYEYNVIKRLLDMAERPDKEERKIVIRTIMEFLCQNTHIVENYHKFRTCLLNKINELQRELLNEPYTANNKPIGDACARLDRIIDDQRPKTYD